MVKEWKIVHKHYAWSHNKFFTGEQANGVKEGRKKLSRWGEGKGKKLREGVVVGERAK